MKTKRDVEREAVRIWRRDGTKNYMSVRTAVFNLQKNGYGMRSSEWIRKELESGHTLFTEYAAFRLA